MTVPCSLGSTSSCIILTATLMSGLPQSVATMTRAVAPTPNTFPASRRNFSSGHCSALSYYHLLSLTISYYQSHHLTSAMLLSFLFFSTPPGRRPASRGFCFSKRRHMVKRISLSFCRFCRLDLQVAPYHPLW